MAEKIEIKVKAKNNNIADTESKGTNKRKVRHNIEKGTTKIYVYPDNLEIAKEELTKNKLEFSISKGDY